MSSTAIAISSVAVAAAEQARTQACQAIVTTFDAKNASVLQMRNYAECVQRIYPDDLSHTEVLIAKSWIVVVFLCIAIGMIAGYRMSDYERTHNMLFGAVGGLIIGVVVPAVLILVALGVRYVFSN